MSSGWPTRLKVEYEAHRASSAGLPRSRSVLFSASTMPGATVLTVIPRAPSCWASVVVSTLIAPLVIEQVVDCYADTHGAFAQRALAEEPTARQAVRRLLAEAMSQQARDGASRADLLAVATAALRGWPEPPGTAPAPAAG
jgi:hypothetical protein